MIINPFNLSTVVNEFHSTHQLLRQSAMWFLKESQLHLHETGGCQKIPLTTSGKIYRSENMVKLAVPLYRWVIVEIKHTLTCRRRENPNCDNNMFWEFETYPYILYSVSKLPSPKAPSMPPPMGKTTAPGTGVPIGGMCSCCSLKTDYTWGSHVWKPLWALIHQEVFIEYIIQMKMRIIILCIYLYIWNRMLQKQ